MATYINPNAIKDGTISASKTDGTIATKEGLTDLSLKVGKFAEVTEQSATPTFTINATNYERNTIVHCGVLSSLTIASIVAIPMEVNIRFQTGESVADFLDIPADAKKVGEVTCEVSSEYVMSILDGVIILGKIE